MSHGLERLASTGLGFGFGLVAHDPAILALAVRQAERSASSLDPVGAFRRAAEACSEFAEANRVAIDPTDQRDKRIDRLDAMFAHGKAAGVAARLADMMRRGGRC